MDAPSPPPIHGRDTQLTELTRLLADVPARGGRVVLVRGEAGVGKTTLVDAFLATRGRFPAYVGGSDDLLVPQPFGPVWDIAIDHAALAGALRSGDRRAVLDATLSLVSGEEPCVLVLEDTQWADEATLDLILLLGRRISRTNVLMVLTYRDGEVDQEHPLRRVIGELPADRVTRITLGGLDLDAVSRVLAGSGLDPQRVLELTDGNALFVREVAASGSTATVPSSVRDAVIARGSRLSPDARRLVDLVSVTPGVTALAVAETALGPLEAAAREVLRHDLLIFGGTTVAFHHELARRAWESALDSETRRRLCRTLLDSVGPDVDPALAVHYATAADDVDALVRLAPVAARAANAMSSHREAARHLRALAPYLDRLEPHEQVSVADLWARSEFYTEGDDYLSVLDDAVRRARDLGDPTMLGHTLMFAVRAYEVSGRTPDAEAASVEAVYLLGVTPPREGLALALATRAWLHLMQGRLDEAADLARTTLDQAGRLDDVRARVHALNTWGSADALRGDLGGLQTLEESRRLAAASGLEFEEARALINLTNAYIEAQRLPEAVDAAERALLTASLHQLPALESYARAQLAETSLLAGLWTRTEEAASEALGSHPHAHLYAAWVLGTLLVRRGHARTRQLLQDAWAMATRNAETQNVLPAAAAIAELLWTVGERPEDLLDDLRSALDHAGTVLPWRRAALSYWLWELDAAEPDPDATGPYGQLMRGEVDRAATGFADLGRPFEQALALSHGARNAQARAVRLLEELGADATADRVRARLRDAGTSLPRGLDRRTRAHPAGLTNRQCEVLELMAQGRTNGQIADDLFLSPRTVENHVGAILIRLDAADRGDAVRRARTRGLLDGTTSSGGDHL